jgi:PAS domain S-box-containing protein
MSMLTHVSNDSPEAVDLGNVVRMSQAISQEIVLETLIHTVLVMSVEHAGAQRGLLILPDGECQRVVAEATTGDQGTAVRLVSECPTPSTLSGSILTHVLGTREDVLLDDASVENPYSADPYITRSHVRCVLCLPLVKPGRLIGVLYLEHSLASQVFTPARIAVLRLLASQAATSLENARLYADLQASENHLRLAVDTIPVIVGRIHGSGSGIEFFNKRWHDYIGETSEESTEAQWMAVVHPDDIPRMIDSWRGAVTRGEPYEHACRMRRADGVYRWFLHRALPLRDEQGAIVKWYAVAHDIDDQRRAEEKVRQDERELRLLVDLLPQFISELNLDGTIRYSNRASREYLGLTLDEITRPGDHRARMYHPGDLAVVRKGLERALSQGVPSELEARLRRHDGVYRWGWIRYEPLRDERGAIVRWYATGVDIDDRKRAEQRIREENLALREEVDKASMFEEIVGASAPLRALLSQVAKVAPTDSTVLITGETGTGKELVARAIHKRSRRATRAFISLNCAVIPSALIASELFGHEKGAFTGALQRRPGRFELAEGGTIFLDEIGELPVETQVALLRVLQERAFERVGGTEVIHVDVRVIVATNRDLSAAIAAGSFRSDLFYRLNVFPVEMPPLRARTEDIPVLVEYFIDRYGSKAGKRIRRIDQSTLELLRSYSWPGNIRELQNVIERAVILCETDTLSVDESWLPRSPAGTGAPDGTLTVAVQAHERALIESALAESKGRVSGRHGAATRLRMPPSTLDARIRSLKIDKHQFTRP